jgi:ABC-2 type transport system permease protein
MTKFLAVVKREYVQRVRTKMFIVATILGPVMIVLFTVVPALIFSIKSGGATRLAIVDQSGKMYERVRQSLLTERRSEEDEEAPAANTNTQQNPLNANVQGQARTPAAKENYAIEQVQTGGRSLEEIRKELKERVLKGELDGYLVIPPDVLESGKVIYYARNLGDVITRGEIRDRVNRAVRSQRMEENGIQPRVMEQINRPIAFSALPADESSEKEDSGGGFYFVFIIGFLIYMSLIMYGQTILAAVIEEKETRISELLFSSIRPFTLMLGKLIGVSLVALTQYAIWALAFAAFALWGVDMFAARGLNISLPAIPAIWILYFFLFFLLGYFLYATIYALVGSMVTTTQEGGQVAMPVLFILIMGFYFAFPVIRSPESPLAFWVSMFPFFSPITMLVRITTQTPPFWQIALSLAIGFVTVILLVWLAARIYRIGMLMYGKRATIPEVMRWVRQT